jgi:hypothetical protein
MSLRMISTPNNPSPTQCRGTQASVRRRSRYRRLSAMNFAIDVRLRFRARSADMKSLTVGRKVRTGEKPAFTSRVDLIVERYCTVAANTA